METLASRITLYDSLTGPAMEMVNSLDEMTEGFRTVEATSQSIGDSDPFDGMRQSIDQSTAAADRMNNTFDMIDGYIQQNNNAQQNFNDTVQRGGGLADELGNKLNKVATILGVSLGAKAGFDFFKDSINLTNQRIQAEQQLVNVLSNQGSSYEDFIALKHEAAAIQDKTMYDAKSMIGGAAEISTYLKDADAVKTMMGTLSNYAAGMSGGAEVSYQQMVEYATQLGKVLNGTYQGIGQKGFELSEVQKAIIESSSLEELIAQGVTLSAEYEQLVQDNFELAKAMVVDEVINQSWADLGEQMAQTPLGMMSNMTNAFNEIRENLGAQLLPVIMQVVTTIQNNMPKIEQTLMGIVNVIQFIISWIGRIYDAALRVYQFFAENWSKIAPIITPIAIAVATVVTAIILYNAAVGIATIAQNIFNSSIWACPLTWIVIALVAVIAAVYWLVDIFNKASGASVSATGIIFGAFTVLGAFLWNLFLGFLELVLGVINYLINPFIEFANFIANVFENPVSSVIYLFQGMADTILALLQKIASALDFIFGSNMAATIEGWRSGLKAKADALVAEFAPDENYQKVINNLDLSVEGLGLQRWSYSDAWDTGYQAGQNVESAIENFDPAAFFDSLFVSGDLDKYEPGDFVNTDGLGGEGFEPSDIGDIADKAGKTAGNTSRMVDISEENLKYLRDIAERDAINRFTTAEVIIDMGGITNNVNSEMDLDGIISYIADGAREALVQVAEGVHY